MKKRILFIEDEAPLQQVVTSSLEEAGYEVLGALDGDVGIKILEEKRPDLVLLDLILPKKDGFNVLEYMQSKEELKDIPVIVLTNLEEKFDIQKAMYNNVRAYLIKTSYSLDEIVEKVKQTV